MKKCGLYIHIPFCKSRCHYCSFYSTTDFSLSQSYLKACLREIRYLSSEYDFDTIYIGGGTPSSIALNDLSFLLGGIVAIASDIKEFTIEVNPESVHPALCSLIKDYGVNRVSMGVQSFSDSVLATLGRIHNGRQAQEAFYELRKASISNINLDFMYDIPGVNFNDIAYSLDIALKLDVEHISAYSYMPDTSYLTDKPADNEEQSELVCEKLGEAGFIHYEISNYAKPGFQAIHNKKYWEMHEYAGVGAGAHSMLHVYDGTEKVRLRYGYSSDIDGYIQDPSSIKVSETIKGKEMIIESLIFRLRLMEPFSLKQLENNFGKLPQDAHDKINKMVLEEMLIRKGEEIVLSTKGMHLLDSIMLFLM